MGGNNNNNNNNDNNNNNNDNNNNNNNNENNNNNNNDNNNNNNNNNEVLLSSTELFYLQKMMKDNENKNKDEEKNKNDSYDDLLNKKKSDDLININKLNLENEIKFDLGFDGYINKNKSLFTMSAETIRTGAKGLQSEEKIKELKCIASKDFFSKEENLNLLNDADKLYIKNNLIGVNDRVVDSNASWKILESAVHVKHMQSMNSQYKNQSLNGDDSSKFMTDFIEKCLFKNRNKIS